MKEIGGYFALEEFHGNEYHEGLVAVNSGRNALLYIVIAKNIKKLYLPYYLCDAISKLCEKNDIQYEFYHIDIKFKPILEKDIEHDASVYIVNYFGQLSKDDIYIYKEKYKNIIVDNAHAFFEKPLNGIDTVYTCRKFFGVSDGGYLSTNIILNDLDQSDISKDRFIHILGRYEENASAYYSYFQQVEEVFYNLPLKYMSKLTRNLLRGINYNSIAKQRQENFAFLHSALKSRNKLDLKIPYGAFMYPFMIDNGMEVRKKLQQMKIYIPTLWPNVLEECKPDTLEYKLAADILPIPVDQRYGIEDMKYLAEVIKNVSTERA